MSETIDEQTLAITHNILYVVFHGELAFQESWESNYIRVYAPAVPTHIYMAGSWLAERTIPAGTTMKLLGVHHGHASLGKAVVRLGKNSEPRPAGAHFEIRLPRPDEILPGFVIGLEPGSISIGDTPVLAGSMDLRPVFKYRMSATPAYLSDLDNDEDDSPTDPNWGAGAGLQGYYSLHVFAEEDSLLIDNDTHAAEAFTKSGQTLGVNKLAVKETLPISLAKSVIPGLHPSELELTLPQRTCVLADLSKQLRRGNGNHLHWHEYKATVPPLPGADEFNELAGAHASCGPIGN